MHVSCGSLKTIRSLAHYGDPVLVRGVAEINQEPTLVAVQGNLNPTDLVWQMSHGNEVINVAINKC